ncbi:hypothetical protein NC652_039536 [Populus alba x Populus x berolinensis]|nr:hypothetical protein NC652_039536 [Populus alba x Populus x berolinensis]
MLLAFWTDAALIAGSGLLFACSSGLQQKSLFCCLQFCSPCSGCFLTGWLVPGSLAEDLWLWFSLHEGCSCYMLFLFA